MLFALIATDEDTARFSTELQAVLTSLPTASVVQPSQPAPTAPAVETTTSQPSDQPPGQPLNLPSTGTDAASAAREARAFYRDVAKAIGQTTLTPEQKATAKAQRQAGVGVAGTAQVIAGTPQPAPQPAAVDSGTAALQAQLAELQARIAQASQAAAQPASQPARPKVKHETIPASATLSQAVCNELQVWAQSLTGDMATGRKGAVVAYATGQANGVQRVMDAYGAKLPKFLGKLNTLVNA